MLIEYCIHIILMSVIGLCLHSFISFGFAEISAWKIDNINLEQYVTH